MASSSHLPNQTFTDAPASSTSKVIAPPTPPKYRHEFYQKQEEVVVTIFAQGIPANSVFVNYKEQILSVTIDVPGEDSYIFEPRLFGKIVPAKCRHVVLSTKVEIRLAKAELIQWTSLEYGAKRKRGRPKKDVGGEPKKKRGRPRKPLPEKPLEAEPEAEPEPEPEPKPDGVCKKKRGRPRKASKANLGEETCVPLVTHIMLRRSAGDVQALSEELPEKQRTEARLQEQVEALNEKLRCEKEKFEDLSSEHNQLISICQEKESALQENCSSQKLQISILQQALAVANQKLQDFKRVEDELRSDLHAAEEANKQKVDKIRRLEEGLKQAEVRAAAAESRLELELSSLRKFMIECDDAANEVDDKVANVKEHVWKDTFTSWRI